MSNKITWAQWSTDEGGNGHWYGLVTAPAETISWTDAAQAATKIGPNTALASLNSKAEHDFVKSELLSTSLSSRIWLGGVLDANGNWKWLNGDPIGFKNWAPGEPNNYLGTEDKLMIYRDGNWNDSYDRWLSRAYLVETDIKPAAPNPPPSSAASTDIILVRVAEDAYWGHAQFQLFVDDQPVGQATTVTAAHGEGQWQDFVFKTDLPADARSVGVVFLNDLYDGTMDTDRNLYLDSITINGATITAGNQAVKDTIDLQIPGQPHGQKPFWLPWSAEATNTVKGSWYGGILQGTDGNDRVQGGAGPDRMAGGAGDDTYLVSSIYDKVVEMPNAGIDSIRSWLDVTRLPDNVENLYLNGEAASTGLGNDLDNRLMGNENANILNGGAGDDILFGNGGADILVGGTGNDIFAYRLLSDAGDVVKDFLPGADMIDLRIIRKAFGQANPDSSPMVDLIQKGDDTEVVVYATSADVDGITMVTLDHVSANQLSFGKDILW